MVGKLHAYRRWLNKLMTHVSTTQIVAIAFAVIILTGAILLTLPIASRSGIGCDFRSALFTSTSATCVTGLVLFDTWTQWSAFGQTVILCLIEIGGLGFMSAASLFVFLLGRKVGLKQRMVMAQAMSMNDVHGIVRLQKLVLFGSLSVQAMGAAVLTLRFWSELGFFKALRWGVFHSISAFCNAGFDIMGCYDPGTSIMRYNTDPVVNLTLMALIVVGGLGFFVWDEVIHQHSFKKFSIYTKLVLTITSILIVSGTVIFALIEWNNPDTLGNMPWYDKILVSAFQSVTLRTAGFAGIDQAKLTDAGKAVSMAYMLVGGSSGSTAGGMKTVTVVVMLLYIWTRARGKENVTIYKRSIPNYQALDAMIITMIMIMLTFFGGIFISVTSGFSLVDAMFETASALATVGLSAGGSGNLSASSQYLIILFMYFGRVGVLTISLGFLMGDRVQERFRYAETKLLIG